MTEIFTRRRRKPDRRTRVARRVDDWPPDDRARWEAAFVARDLFDEAGAGAHLSPASQRAMAYAYGRWLGFLTRSDQSILMIGLENRVTRERVVGFCESLAETNSALSIATVLHQFRLALRLLAPETDWHWLHTIQKRITFKARARPKRSRQQDADKLQALGRRLMDEALEQSAAAGTISSRMALAYRDGLIIYILVLLSPRRRNIAGLTIGKNLLRTGTVWHIRFEENETKNKRASDIPLPGELASYVEAYLNRFRRAFHGEGDHAGVWASVKGRPMADNAIYDAVCRRTKQEFGQSMNLHLFRDANATSLAIHAPEQVRAAAALLGHTSFGPTQKHYIRAHGISAARLLAEAIQKRASSDGGCGKSSGSL